MTDYDVKEMAQALRFTLPQAELHPAFGQLIAALQTEPNDPPPPSGGQGEPSVLRLANRLWKDQTFQLLPQFANVNADCYGAPIAELDFRGDPEGSRHTINDWVADQTNEKIKDLLPEESVSPLTRLVLTNAIYFKAGWSKAFREEATCPQAFTVGHGVTFDVDMMHQMDHFGYASLPQCQVLEMGYTNSTLSMLVLLPSQTDGLRELEAWLTPETLQQCVDELRGAKVVVSLPIRCLSWRTWRHWAWSKRLTATAPISSG